MWLCFMRAQVFSQHPCYSNKGYRHFHIISKGDEASTYLQQLKCQSRGASKPSVSKRFKFDQYLSIYSRQSELVPSSHISNILTIRNSTFTVRKEPPISYSGSPSSFHEQFSHNLTKHNGGQGTPQTTPQMDRPSNSVKP